MVVALLLMLPVWARAQFDPQIGHYMYMPTAYNPAAAGDGDLMRVSGLHRMQFTGIQGAPMTTYFSFSSPFVIGKTRHAAGVRFLNDMYGLWSNQAFHAQYAYRQRLGNGTLALGVDLGLVNIKFQGDSVNLDGMGDSEYHQSTDPAIPISESSGMQFDMGVGLYYSTAKWWVGASYEHLTQPKIELNTQTAAEGSRITLRGTMYVQGGYKFRLRNKDFALTPSGILQTDFRAWDANVSLMCDYKDKYSWGLSYRIAANVAVLLGVEVANGLRLGYTYELPTSKLLLESFGSHEIYLSYGFDILRPRRTNKYKSVRYL